MDVFWKIVLVMDAVLLVILIPFAYFRYEGDEEAGFVSQNRIIFLLKILPQFKRTSSAICYTIATVAFFALIIGITYAFWKTASIPVVAYTVTVSTTSSSTTKTSWTTLSAVKKYFKNRV